MTAKHPYANAKVIQAEVKWSKNSSGGFRSTYLLEEATSMYELVHWSYSSLTSLHGQKHPPENVAQILV